MSKLVGDDLSLVPGGAAFRDDSVYLVAPYDDNTVLVATRDRGLFLLGDGEALPFANEVDAQLRQNPVYHGLWLDAERLALATPAGVVIINRRGEHETTLDTASGLQTSNARFVYLDREEGLWIAMNRGLARVELFSPFAKITERQGLRGVAVDVARWQDRLYVGTTEGLFVAAADAGGPEETFQLVGDIRWPVFSLEQVQGSLLAATNHGLFEILGGGVELIQSGTYTVLHASNNAPGTVYAGRIDGFEAWRAEDSTWSLLGDYAAGDWVHTLAQASDGTLWLGTRATGFVRMTVDASGKPIEPLRRYTTRDGLPGGESAVYSVGGDVLFATDLGLVRLAMPQPTGSNPTAALAQPSPMVRAG